MHTTSNVRLEAVCHTTSVTAAFTAGFSVHKVVFGSEYATTIKQVWSVVDVRTGIV